MRLADLSKYEVINGRVNIPCDECGEAREVNYQNFKNRLERKGTGPMVCPPCNRRLIKKAGGRFNYE
jgi:hypothetical protein